jgi:hypothetical protein
MADLPPWQQALLYENCANPYPFYAELRKTPVSRQPDGSYVVSAGQLGSSKAAKGVVGWGGSC